MKNIWIKTSGIVVYQYQPWGNNSYINDIRMPISLEIRLLNKLQSFYLGQNGLANWSSFLVAYPEIANDIISELIRITQMSDIYIFSLKKENAKTILLYKHY